MPPLASLPPDLLLKTATFLGPGTLSALVQTCKTWQRLFDQPLFDALVVVFNRDKKMLSAFSREVVRQTSDCASYSIKYLADAYCARHSRFEYACNKWQLTEFMTIDFRHSLDEEDFADLCGFLASSSVPVLDPGSLQSSRLSSSPVLVEKLYFLGPTVLYEEQMAMFLPAAAFLTALRFHSHFIPGIDRLVRLPRLRKLCLRNVNLAPQMQAFCDALQVSRVNDLVVQDCGFNDYEWNLLAAALPFTALRDLCIIGGDYPRSEVTKRALAKGAAAIGCHLRL